MIRNAYKNKYFSVKGRKRERFKYSFDYYVFMHKKEVSKDWKLCPRADSRMEWICRHGVGHGLGVHGCHASDKGDGSACCSDPNFPGKHVKVGDTLTDEYGNEYLITRKDFDGFHWKGVKK
jgi:hypothetical protein